MPDNKITFRCPVCGINLNVPASLAGVTGPCPSCKATIQAPLLAPSPAEKIIPKKVSELKQEAKPESPKGHSVILPAHREIVDQAAAATPSLPEEPLPKAVQWSPLFLILSVAAFILAAVILALIISNKLPTQDTPPPKTTITTPSTSAKPVQEPEKKEVLQLSPPSLPPGPAKIAENPLPIPRVKTPPVQPMTARDVLNQFLTAKSLEERSRILETQTPASELAESCLAGSFPPATRIEIESKESRALEQIVETYYAVDFPEIQSPF
ncbi:MAG: hypothetical protein HC845_06500 [Akkermansiaceae bacterium]|nr:hypothetical protein [Akkermansiaceae bacterium]